MTTAPPTDAAGKVRVVPVILAGGSGTRLWPLSRAAFPKHLVELLGESSLLQATAARLLRIAPAERIVTVAAAGQAVLVRRQLAELDEALLANVLLEPEPRNTAAAVALAAHHACARFGAEAVVWVCPSDHLILDVPALLEAARVGSRAAAAGRLVTFGIEPSRPETGFGWIAVGDPHDLAGVRDVRAFVEKPPAEEARRMLEAGGHLWNSGMFMFRPDVFLDELARHEPELAEGVAATHRTLERSPERGPDPAIYATLRSIPVDKAVMERSRNVAVVPCDPRWSDVGSWQALFELMPKDPAGNAIQGDGIVEGASGNLVRAEHRLVALAGVSGLAVVETSDAVLVGDLTNSEAVRGVVSQLGKRQRPEAAVHPREHRPWGSFGTLAAGAGFRVREVSVDPGARIAKQRHPSRDKQWVVVSGRARVEIDGGGRELGPSQAVAVSRGSVHRLINPGSEPLRVIEVALGDVLDDAGIERFPD